MNDGKPDRLFVGLNSIGVISDTANIIAQTGSHYDGRLTPWQPGASLAFNGGHLTLGVHGEYDEGSLAGVPFTLRLWRIQSTFAPNAHLAISTVAQYDSTAAEAGINARLTWTFSPGHDLFVVWTRHYIDPTDGGLRSLQRDADEIILKLKWDVRL